MYRRIFTSFLIALAFLFFTQLNFVQADTPTDNDIYEEYALSQNREEVLKKLIPGTEIYYFLYTLYYQQTNQLEKAGNILNKWAEILSKNKKYFTLKNRQTLLLLDNNFNDSLNTIKESLNLQFSYDRPVSNTPQNYPSKVQEKEYQFNQEPILRYAGNNLNSHLTVNGFYAISEKELTKEQIISILTNYPYPDLPNLIDLILKNYEKEPSRLFGSLNAHKKLTLKQLNELKEKRPSLINEETFVITYLQMLVPTIKNFKQKPEIYKKYLLESYQFVKDLNASLNTLKAAILYEYLSQNLITNTPDFAMFIEFLKYPRNTIYANVSAFNKAYSLVEFIKYSRTFDSLPLSTMQEDISIVEEYLYLYIQNKLPTESLLPYLSSDYLKKIEAQAKIKLGLAPPEEFLNILKPFDYEQLKNEVLLSFTKDNLTEFSSNDIPKLTLKVKNCPDLEVKIFQINALDYYRNKLQEIPSNISLEGYIPNLTKKISYTENSYLQHKETIELPELKDPGVFVVEMIGNGVKTRAFINKGKIFPSIYPSNSGHEIQLFDENQTLIKNYTVYFGSHQYISDKEGRIYIPYATPKTAGLKSLVFSVGQISCLYSFYHKAESFELANLILNQSESLIPGQNNQLLTKLILKQNEKPIAINKLKEANAFINLIDDNGKLITSQTYPIDTKTEFQKFDFFLPEKTSAIKISIQAKLQRLSDDEIKNINTINFIDVVGAMHVGNIYGLYLRKQNKNYQIECLNKSGIPQANISVQVTLSNNLLIKPFEFTLQTDHNGQIQLDTLRQIAKVKARILNGPAFTWMLQDKYTLRPSLITCLENEKIEIPFHASSKNLAEDILFLELSGNNNLADLTTSVQYKNQTLYLPTNKEGKYHLYLKSEKTKIEIHILKGKKENHFLITEDTIQDETTYFSHQFQLEPINENSESIKGKLLNPNITMKVFYFAGHYLGNQSNLIFSSDNLFAWPENITSFQRFENKYFESIKLSSESIYISQRRNLTKYPGNNLPSPSTLLNPWDVSETEIKYEQALDGGTFGKRRNLMNGGKKAASPAESASDHINRNAASIQSMASLNFFNKAPIYEIAIQKDGSFELSLKELKDYSHFQIAVISNYGYLIKDIALPAKKNILLDIRQTKNASSQEEKLPTYILTKTNADKAISFSLNNDKQYLKIDTLTKLSTTLFKIIKNDELSEFQFLNQWSSLNEAQKLNYYKDFACHELHFFLYQKDKPFFTKHIKPFLENKQVKSVVDLYILEKDLSNFAEFYQFNTLNLFEKILVAKRTPTLIEKLRNQIKPLLEKDKTNLPKELELMEQLLNAEKTNAEKSEQRLVQQVKSDFKGDIGGNSNEAKTTMDSPTAAKEEIRTLNEDIAIDGDAQEKLYRPIQETDTYAEANYYHLLKTEETSSLIQPNQFWLDFLNNSSSTFVSENILALKNIHEALLVLALTDLPETIENSNSTDTIKGQQLIIQSKTSSILLLKSFIDGKNQFEFFSLQQHYYYITDNEKQILNTKETPFVTNKVYNSLAILTNTSSKTREAYLNILIPEGALPLGLSKKEKTLFVRIEPFQTYVTETQFFFPLDGTFSHLPAKATDNTSIFTNEKVYDLKVVSKELPPEQNTWDALVQIGNKESILPYIKTHHILETPLSQIYYMLRDKDFYERLTDILTEKYDFDYVVWSFSLYHKDKKRFADFLSNTFLANECGVYFLSPYLKIDPIIRKTYEHIEFFPLIKGRIHDIEPKNRFENATLEQQYNNFIQILIYKNKLDQHDLLNLTIYTLNQNKIAEALSYFSQISPAEVNEKIQYDYLKAYLAFYKSDLATATKIVEDYKNLAVPHWKDKFTELALQLKEIKEEKIDDKARKSHYSTTALANQEPMIYLENKNGDISLQCNNLTEVETEYYLTDIEILFSNAPFDATNQDYNFLTVPNKTEKINITKQNTPFALQIPAELKSKNLIIKVRGNGKQAFTTYYPNQMQIRIADNYGELRIIKKDSQTPLHTIYVKVYGKTDSGVEFIKDGYTDLRGIFSYTDVNGKVISKYKSLAILVLSDVYGASIEYTTPPAH